MFSDIELMLSMLINFMLETFTNLIIIQYQLS